MTVVAFSPEIVREQAPSPLFLYMFPVAPYPAPRSA